MRLGVVGGTFDPIHLGHVAMAEAGAVCARLDRVLLVPASIPPHRAAAAAPAADRLAMTRLAAAGHGLLEVSDIELRRSGPSYTVDTLRELAGEWPGWDLYLVLGWDAAREISSWRAPDEVMRLARLVVVTRPGRTTPTERDLLVAGIDPAGTILCDVATPAVESTDVRQLVERGASLEGLLHPGVEGYLRSHHLYTAQV
jgi:nicotinate-nucleotide adenylyltransferase